MKLGVANIKCSSIYVGEMRNATISLSNGSESIYEVPNYLDWHWFSNYGFLDSTSSENAWEWTQPIESLNLDSETIGDFALDGCQTLQSVTLSSNVKSIGESAFYQCHNLQTIEGLDNVTYISRWAFDQCYNLQLDHLPPNLTFMDYGAFSNCQHLTGEITIPSGLTWIGDQTFYNCFRMTGVTIPSGITEVGENAFQDCTGLTHITFLGKTIEQVRAMTDYPWGANESIIGVA